MFEAALSHSIVLGILMTILYRERQDARVAIAAAICFFCGFTGHSLLPFGFGVPVSFALAFVFLLLNTTDVIHPRIPPSMLLWLGIVAASVFMSYAIAGPVDGMVPWRKSVSQLIAHVAFVLTGIAIAAVISTLDDLQRLLKYLIAGAVFSAVFALLQLLLVDLGQYALADLFWNNPSYGGVVAKNTGLIPAHVAKSRLGITRVWGPAMEPSYLGSYLAFVFLTWLGLLLESARQRRPLHYAGLTIVLISILATQARGALLALAVGLAGLMLLRVDIHRVWRRAFTAAGMSLVILVMWFSTAMALSLDPLDILVERFGFLKTTENIHDDYSAGARLAALRIAWDIAADYPVLGVGIGNYGFHIYDYIRPEYRYDEFRAGEWHVPFGWPATIISETGLLGSVAFLAWLIALLRTGPRLFRRTALRPMSGLYWGFVSLVVGGIAGSQVITPYWWVAVGILSACTYMGSRKTVRLGLVVETVGAARQGEIKV